MITLVAATITKIVQEQPRNRIIRIYSSNIARLARERDVLEQTTGGIEISFYESILINLSAGQEIFAISAVTPNISIIEVNAQGEALL